MNFPVRILVNPRAGRGRAQRGLEGLRRALEAAGLPFELEATQGAGGGAAAARRAVERGASVVVAVGGDGTVNEVVNGLASAVAPGAPLGPLVVLPAGSGNDFAATTASPRDVDQLVRVLREPRPRRIDLGRVRLRTESGEIERWFDNTLGLGFEARVNWQAQHIRFLRGLPLYTLAAARALRELRPYPFEIRWEDEYGERRAQSGDYAMVTAGNGPRSGGGFYLTPDSRQDDGLLELGTVAHIGRFEILRLLPKVMRGRHVGHPAVRIERCRRFELSSAVPFSVHADGEFLDSAVRELSVELEPGRLLLHV